MAYANIIQIDATRRFRRGFPCYICGGHKDMPAGKRVRCAGYLSGDSRYAHCTREEYAGGIQPTEALPPTYAHLLRGKCQCGSVHLSAIADLGATRRTDARAPLKGGKGAAPKKPATRKSSQSHSAAVVTRFEAIAADGAVVGVHGRRDYRAADGSPAKTVWWEQHNGRSSRDMPLYRLPLLLQAAPGDCVGLVEGEKSTDALVNAGILTVGTMCGAATTPCNEALRPLLRHTVVLWPDNDQDGERHMRAIARRLLRLGMPRERLRWVEWDGAPAKGDAADYLAAGGTVAAIPSMSHELPADIHAEEGDEGDDTATATATATATDTDTDTAPANTLLGVSLYDIQVERFEWLWERRIALGKVSTADGDGGVGKSMVTLDVAARVAEGRDMPDDTPGLGAPAGVLLVCGEDGLADTVKPRMLAAGCAPDALRRVRAVNLVPEVHADGQETQRMLSLSLDLAAIEETLIAIGAKLLVIDPITAYLGDKIDAHKDAEVRRVLTPLAIMAERLHVAVVLIRHLNRAHGAPAQQRGMGSGAFLNVARIGLLFAPDPNNDGQYLVSRYKGNIGPTPPTMAYRIAQIGAEENMPRVAWQGASEMSAEAALAVLGRVDASEQGEKRSAVDEAILFLCDELAEGERQVEDVNKAARALGISDASLKRARNKMDLKPHKGGELGSKGFWLLPQIDYRKRAYWQGKARQQHDEQYESITPTSLQHERLSDGEGYQPGKNGHSA